jgi:hypothetical protein
MAPAATSKEGGKSGIRGRMFMLMAVPSLIGSEHPLERSARCALVSLAG